MVFNTGRRNTTVSCGAEALKAAGLGLACGRRESGRDTCLGQSTVGHPDATEQVLVLPVPVAMSQIYSPANNETLAEQTGYAVSEQHCCFKGP